MRKVLVTGSTGHLGEAMMRTLLSKEIDTIGLDINPGEFTDVVGSITDREFMSSLFEGSNFDTVFHSATLHKPHVVTHSMEEFIETNVLGTLNLLEESWEHNIEAFVFTSTTSVFGDNLRPSDDDPAVWITENLDSPPKNIYGATKAAAEDLCRLFYRNLDFKSIVLRTSRFFPEEDDREERRNAFVDDNLKVNELLYRRVDIEDVVEAHLLARERIDDIGFGKYIISSTTPFDNREEELLKLRKDPASVVDERLNCEWREIYDSLGWRMLDDIDRVYVSRAAMRDLGWKPKYTFDYAIDRLVNGLDYRSPLAREVGSKGYHSFEEFGDMEYYPVND